MTVGSSLSGVSQDGPDGPRSSTTEVPRRTVNVWPSSAGPNRNTPPVTGGGAVLTGAGVGRTVRPGPVVAVPTGSGVAPPTAAAVPAPLGAADATPPAGPAAVVPA